MRTQTAAAAATDAKVDRRSISMGAPAGYRVRYLPGRAQLLRSPFGSRSWLPLVLICFDAPVDAPAWLADLPSRLASRIAARFWSGPPGLSAMLVSTRLRWRMWYPALAEPSTRWPIRYGPPDPDIFARTR